MTEPYRLADPHAYLGAHKARRRRRRPRVPARTPSRCASCRWASSSSRRTAPGLFEGVVDDASCRSTTSSRCATRPATPSRSATRTRSCRRSASSTSTSPARAGTRSSTAGSARTSASVDGVAGRRLRGLGAERALGQRRRRLQRLGRPPPPDALARRVRDLGALRPRRRAGRALQVRDPRRRTGRLRLKADPSRSATEVPPKNASIVHALGVRVAGRGVARAPPRAASRCTRARSRSTRCTSARGG